MIIRPSTPPNVAVLTHLCVISCHFCCPMLLFQGHVSVAILLLSLCFSLSLLQFHPTFVSFLAIFALLCCCFKVMSVSLFYYCLCDFLFHCCKRFQPIFVSFLTISAVLCFCFKAMLCVGILPNMGLITVKSAFQLHF